MIVKLPETYEQIRCEWCGNTSKNRDSRGGCVGCGAQATLPKPIVSGRPYQSPYHPPEQGRVEPVIMVPDPNNFGREIQIGTDFTWAEILRLIAEWREP